MVTEIKDIISRLDNIQNDIEYIKGHMVERDEIMNSDEFEAYNRSLDKKNLKSLDDARNELGL